MKIYHYNAKTFVFLNITEADPNPLEPGKFLIPANSTVKPVPSYKDGEVAVFANNTWKVAKDTRGVWYDNAGIKYDFQTFGDNTSKLSRNPKPSAFHEIVSGNWVLTPEGEGKKHELEHNQVLDVFRAQREMALNRLIGITFQAQSRGNQVLVNACLLVRQSLLDIPQHADVIRTKTKDELVLAIRELMRVLADLIPEQRNALSCISI